MFDRSVKPAFIAAVATLLVCGLGFRFAVRQAQVFLAKAPVELRNPLTAIPKRLSVWEASRPDQTLTAEVEQELGTRQYLDRVYERAVGRRAQAVMVHVAYYTGIIDAVPHVPDRCLAAGGWVAVGLPRNLPLPLDQTGWVADPDHRNLSTGLPYSLLTYPHHVTGDDVTVRMPVGEFKLRTSEFLGGEHLDQRIFAGYFFIANGQTTPSPEGVRRFAFDLSTEYAYYAKIQFTMFVSEDATLEDFAATVADLANELLPELMWCLPDWAEVESF